MRRALILFAILLASPSVFAVQLQCIGYCKNGSAAATGKRASGSNLGDQLEALKSATTALYNLCKSPQVLSGIKCTVVSSKDNGLNSQNYQNVTQAQSSTYVVGGTRPNRTTNPCLGGCGGGAGGGPARIDSAP